MTLEGLFADLIQAVPRIKSKTSGEAFFGPRQDIHVALQELSPPLLALHTSIVSVITEHGGIFNEPQYHLDGYRPHITLTNGPTATTEAILTGLSLIDMFPSGDHRMRRVVWTYDLST